MPMNIKSLAKPLLILIGLCVLCVVPLAAQDADVAYAEALRRIEEARVSGGTSLDLGNLSLTRLPPEIGQLTNLMYLFLSDNQLSTLPPEFGRLTNLQYLHLANNRLTALFSEIGQLKNLQELHIPVNQLENLHSDIGMFGNTPFL